MLSGRFAFPADGKLVRDLIPDVIRASGVEPLIREAHRDELPGLLRAKLEEELAEALCSGHPEDPEEFADLLEVLYALAALQGLTPFDLESIRERKAAERGGFEKCLVWLGNRAGDAA
ncbi:hypothetical protein GT755_12320 [Herbidospora sp. NEAU-GS84]|uniref:Phosphoribosyl-ATP pyrophosphohydrolase n=1 Tax=Herbidospora solisilvae TaxID=2696284 RepID=A0A7C9J264_9ACTN|nr:hypothetical protein [Herbidospora solisilvae]